MRRIVALLALVIGVGALLYAGAQIVLLTWGKTGDARIVRVAYDDPETEIRRQRRSASKATGYFKIAITVDYRFDVPPSPAEALRRGSNEPLERNVEGSDTLHWRSRDTEAEPLREGQPIAVRYFPAYPAWNRLDRPGALKGAAVTFGSGGLVLVLLGTLLRPRATAAGKPRRKGAPGAAKGREPAA